MSSGDRRTLCFVALESVALSRVASASAWLAVGVVWLVSGFVLLFYPHGFSSNGHDTNTTLAAAAHLAGTLALTTCCTACRFGRAALHPIFEPGAAPRFWD